ncbi:MAG TPA: hypothetical protein VM031_06440 [Phycisphaerae bacterium]|nr:hypothetical protein [Phycisphaerae bacterium]
MKNIALRKAGIFAVVTLLILVAGCTTHEQLLRNSMARNPNAPEWVHGRMPSEASLIYFVGRGVGRNVLDEQGAYQAARNHAIEQMALQIGSRVTIGLGRTATRRHATAEGDATTYGRRITILPDGMAAAPFPWMRGEDYAANVNSGSALAADTLAGDLIEQDIYWEQWYVNDRPERTWAGFRGQRRYKCWLLMAVPREKFDERVQVASMLVLRKAVVTLMKARDHAKYRVTQAHRQAKIAVAQRIYNKEVARHGAARPDTVFDVVDSHSHGLSSGKNYTVQDTKDILDGARILHANNKDIYTAAEIETMLATNRRFYDIYQLIDFEAPDTGESVDLPLSLIRAKSVSEAADKLFEIYEEMSVDRAGATPRSKLKEPKLVP